MDRLNNGRPASLAGENPRQGGVEALKFAPQSLPDAPALNQLSTYLELLKLRIVASVVLASLAGYLMARPATFSWTDLLSLAAVSFLCSAASCVFNHAYEAELDGRMARTRGRPLPSGRLKDPRRVWLLCYGLFAAGAAVAIVFLNLSVLACFALGFATYALVYTVWLKPRTPWSIVWGGAAGSFALLGGAVAARGGQLLAAAIVAGVFFLWTPPHYWSIALRYRDDYARSGIPVLPIVAGEARTARIILLSTALMVLVSVLLPLLLGAFGPFYYACAFLAATIFLAGNWRLLKTPTGSARLNFGLSFVYLAIYFVGSVVDAGFLGDAGNLKGFGLMARKFMDTASLY